MQAEAGQVELIRLRRFVKARQHAGDLVRILRVQLAPVVVFIKTPQATMSKAPDHSFGIYSDNCHLSILVAYACGGVQHYRSVTHHSPEADLSRIRQMDRGDTPKGLENLAKTWIPTFTRCPAHFLRFRLGKPLKYMENSPQLLGNSKAIWRIRVQIAGGIDPERQDIVVVEQPAVE